MKFKRTIGLIGGLGPFAGAYALNRLFEMAASDYGCEEDEDFPEIILSSVPFKGTSLAGLQENNAVKTALRDGLYLLEDCGAKLATIVCNSSHVFLPELAPTSNIEIVSLIDSVLDKLKSFETDSFCALCSRSAREAKLFEALAARSGKRFVALSAQQAELTDELIGLGMRATLCDRFVAELPSLIESVSLKGRRAVVIGCTELSRLGSGGLKAAPYIIDTLDEALALLLKKAL